MNVFGPSATFKKAGTLNQSTNQTHFSQRPLYELRMQLTVWKYKKVPSIPIFREINL